MCCRALEIIVNAMPMRLSKHIWILIHCSMEWQIMELQLQ